MKNKTINFIFILLFLTGLYWPSSTNYVINFKYEQIMFFVIMIVLTFLLILNKRFLAEFWKKFAYSFLILTIIIFFAFISVLKGHTESYLGVSVQYIILSLLFLSDYTSVELTKFTKKIFTLTNVINIALGFMIIFDIAVVKDFFYKNYSAYYPELIYNMLFQKKPVIMFASHGMASAFHYLFFFMFFYSFVVTKNKLHFVLSILNLILLIFTRSTSAFILFIAATINIVYFSYKKSRNKGLILISVFSLGIIAIITFMNSGLMPDLNSNINGFRGRYSNSGVIRPIINYILGNPFTPIGVVNIPNLFSMDSGWLINMLRGSIFLIVAVYTGFYSFLKTNIKGKIALWLFMIFAAVEVGCQIITYVRMMCFLPFFVIYLHDLVIRQPQGHAAE